MGQGNGRDRVGFRDRAVGDDGFHRHGKPAVVAKLLPAHGAPRHGFYNAVLATVALLLLAAIAAVPLLRWGRTPGRRATSRAVDRRGGGPRRGRAGMARRSAAPRDDCRRRLGGRHGDGNCRIVAPRRPAVVGRHLWLGLPKAFRNRRRTYAGYAMHLALASLALGVAGSSLGTQQHEATLAQGESARWTGRDVRFVRLFQHRLADRLLVQAELEVTAAGALPSRCSPRRPVLLPPKRVETGRSPFIPPGAALYAILHGGEGQERFD